jgi:hypothetical protein
MASGSATARQLNEKRATMLNFMLRFAWKIWVGFWQMEYLAVDKVEYL